MATMDVKDASGATVAIEKPLVPGRTAATTSRPVVLSNEDLAALAAIEAKFPAALGAQTSLLSFSVTHASDDAGLFALGVIATGQGDVDDPKILDADASASVTARLAGISQYLEDIYTQDAIAYANTAPFETLDSAASTPNGLTNSRIKSAATTNATSLKASAGRIYSIDVYNNTASAKFLKIYNKASAPTVGADTPVRTIPIPANGGYARHFPLGLYQATGLAYAITGLIGDSDTTVVAVDDVTGGIQWI